MNFYNPEEWTYVNGVLIMPPESEEAAEYADIVAEALFEFYDISHPWMDYKQAADAIGRDSDQRFIQKGTCDHCGARFNYGAMFHNDLTGETAVVGHICAVNTLSLNASQAVYKRMQTAKKAILTRLQGDSREASLSNRRRTLLTGTHHIVKDIRTQFRHKGFLSVAQWDLVKKLGVPVMEKCTHPIMPVVEGKIEIKGIIKGTKEVPDHYNPYGGSITKMIVEDHRGFKVFGTLPAKLYELASGFRGTAVSFVATVQKSRTDDHFGFYKRPSKIKVLS